MTVDIGAGDGKFALWQAAGDRSRLVVALDANAAALSAGHSRAARRRLGNALFVVAAAEELPSELRGLASEVRIHFPWASLLRLVLTADPRFLGQVAELLVPQGQLVVGLSVVPQDGVADLSELDRTGAAELLGRLQATGAFAAGRVTELTPRTVRELHSTWANRLQVGRQRQGWLIETVRSPRWPPDRLGSARPESGALRRVQSEGVARRARH